MTHTALIADIGGTNTRVALAHGPEIDHSTIHRYANAKFPGFESVIAEYLRQTGGANVQRACVAVAGPVRDGAASMTNLDWQLDRETISRATGAPVENVAVLNDLQAQGHALGHLEPSSLTPVVTSSATPGPNAAQLVINVGTGFNAAPVLATASGRYVPASEAGHANMPIRTEEELRLCRYVETAHGFPAVEDVLSGRGLERVYQWRGTESEASAELRGAEIIAAACDGSDPRAVEAVEVFLRILGTVSGNLALIHLPFGGIFLVGGVALGLAPLLTTPTFATAFRDKGRFAGFMGNFSVTLVQDDYAALIGSAHHLNSHTLT
ncbi:ROK family protein [Vannielia sp.]|uniref:glucokinase n=1 Tax=Vannielia sp. TaxID=2813045 RepID=UPI0026152B17|nr:ROK family protein [Vannielia sp.]MDF1872060.1 ROK family protein [Vannielia sp.]